MSEEESPMGQLRTTSLQITCFVTFTVLAGVVALEGKEFPADACTLLPATQVSKVLNQTFGSPSRTWAPVVAPSTVRGTDCKYRTQSGSELLFRIYADPSVDVAKETFTKLSTHFGPNKTVDGNWDEAYFDARHSLHVRKGKERYFMRLNPLGAEADQTEKLLKKLATSVAEQL
jgi:hypothetical protein